MQYKALAFVAALAMGVRAQVAPEVSESVISVLLTALPSSDLALAYTNPAAFQSQMYSSLSASNIPDWYQSLPADVKTILPQLYPAAAEATPTGEATTTTAVETTTAAAGTISGKPTGGSNGTSTVNSPTLSTTSGSGSPSETSNGASMPTAVIGSGIVGAFGVLGMLVL